MQDLRPDDRDLHSRPRILRLVRRMDHSMQPDTTPTPTNPEDDKLDDTLLRFAQQCDDEAGEWINDDKLDDSLANQRHDELMQLETMARLMHQLYVNYGAPAMDTEQIRQGLAYGARFLETLEAQRHAMGTPPPSGPPTPTPPAHGVGG